MLASKLFSIIIVDNFFCLVNIHLLIKGIKFMSKQDHNDQNSAPRLMNDPGNSIVRRITLEDKPMVHNIPPHYVGYTDLTINYHAMIATDLGGNIALAVHNHTAHRAALAHIDVTTSSTSILRVLDKMRKNKDDILDLVISGGNDSTYKKFAPLVAFLESLPKTKIIKNDSFLKGETTPSTQHLGINAHGLYYEDKATLWYAVVHPSNSPQAKNINYFREVGGTYPIIEINYSLPDPDFKPLVIIGSHHPFDNQ